MRTIPEIEQQLSYYIEEVTFQNVLAKDIKSQMHLLKDLGLDSMDYASVMLSCEQWLGTKINEDDVNWAEVQTVEELANILYESQKNG